MKNIIIVILISILIISNSYSQQVWESTNLPSSNAFFSDIDFISANIGFAGTYGGGNIKQVFKTTDKGVTWVSIWTVNSNSSNVYSISVDFINENTGFISYDDKIVKYVNGTTSIVYNFPAAVGVPKSLLK